MDRCIDHRLFFSGSKSSFFILYFSDFDTDSDLACPNFGLTSDF